MLERLETKFDLAISAHHLAPQKGQVRGVSGAALKRILGKFGEHRPGLDQLDEIARVSVLRELEAYLVERVRDWHSLKRLEFAFDISKTGVGIKIDF